MTMLQSGEAAAAPAAGVKDTTTQTFVKDVIEESKRQPVLVDFWAEWCGPCKMLAPVLEQIATEQQERLVVAKVNVDENPALAARFEIQSIPTLLYFSGGKLRDKSVGVISKKEIGNRVAALVGAQPV